MRASRRFLYESRFGSLCDLQIESGKWCVLRSDHQFSRISRDASPPAERFLGKNARCMWIVICLGEMRQHDIPRAPVKPFWIREKFTDRVIGKMSGAAHHALLDV